jgi:protein tyrosine/serine phosphatase
MFSLEEDLSESRVRGLDRMRAYLQTTIVDHGLVRLVYSHRFQVSSGYWRSAQPGPLKLGWASARGIRTVINLRGRRLDCGSYLLERDACRALGLRLIDYPMRSRRVPKRDVVLGAIDLLQSVEGPVLVHCKTGTDRAGFMTVLYLHVVEGVPIDRALNALSLRYGHVRTARTGHLTAFFRAYQARAAQSPISLRDWVAHEYDPAQLQREFTAGRWSDFLVDRILRRE